MPREFPLVITSLGTKFVPFFPVTLEEGDQLILVRELGGSQVPRGEVWLVNGYSSAGPIVTKKDVEVS